MRLAVWSAVLYAIQVVVGGLQILTTLAGWAQVLHLALGTIIWSMLVGLAVTSYYTARVTARTGTGLGTGVDADAAGRHGRPRRAARASGPTSP